MRYFLSQKKVTEENAGMQTGPATTEPGLSFAAARCRSFLAGKEVRQEKANALLSQKKVTKENAGMQTGPATTEPGLSFAAARCRSFLAGKEVRQEKATTLLSFAKESNQRKRGGCLSAIALTTAEAGGG